ncbi:FxsA family protein [Chloroflexota bacterium]
MFFRILLLFIFTPLIGLGILIYLGTIIGILYTILIVLATGILGAFIARSQSLAVLSRIRSSIGQGIIPSGELFDGALILASGLLLLTPGIITDIIGFTVLVPQTRRIINRWFRSLIRRQIQRGEIRYRHIR